MTARGVAAPVTAALRWEGTSGEHGAQHERQPRDAHGGEKNGPAGLPLGRSDFFQDPPSETAREFASIAPVIRWFFFQRKFFFDE